jgi:predicted ATP-grasp superfamily ATP-dependent carboligase
MAVADWEAMQIAGHKRKTMEVAKQVGLHVPKTYSAPEEVESFPVVVKPSLGSGTVQFVNSMPELMAAYEADCVIQDYIAGQGFGFSALLRHGELRACCMHRRVREFPITGGASTAAVTVLKPELRRAGMRILQELKWHGVAMVEFKKDERDGQYKLLEINPKFWGSLDLPIAAGVDFPTLTARLALEGDVETVPDAPPGIKFHWIWDDLLHLAANPSSWNAVMHDMVSRDVASDLDWSDPIPFLVHGGYMLRRLLGLLLKAKLRYPQGRASATSAAQGNGRAAKSHR